ncbi:MAG: hypothetical protein NTV37_08250 [Proteobacteria bacterium]|nr:hypothetical protein [Pseudomonadota bacterium]
MRTAATGSNPTFFLNLLDNDAIISRFSNGGSIPLGIAITRDYLEPRHDSYFAVSLRDGFPPTFQNEIWVDKCDVPYIPLGKVNGLEFPIEITLTSFYGCIAGLPPPHPIPNFVASYSAPSIVTIADGNDSLPWAEFDFGYRIGRIIIAEAPKTIPIFSVTELNILTLPPPAIEGSAVEYNNTIDFPSAPGGHFFYSSDAAEQSYIDSGQAGHFQRTGRSFNTGGYVPVCRFYGSQTPGPNSHFFSADQNECSGLKAVQKSPVPIDVPQWNSEGSGFYAVAIVVDASGNRTCLKGTVPVYRAYNNAYAQTGKRNSWDSNHRFSTSHAEIDQMIINYGWSDEGITFCAPA